jgi:hypothetical protein
MPDLPPTSSGTDRVPRPFPQKLAISAVVWLALTVLRIPLAIDPIQKFDEPLTIDPKQDFLILRIILRKFLIAASGTAFDVYPNLAVD